MGIIPVFERTVNISHKKMHLCSVLILVTVLPLQGLPQPHHQLPTPDLNPGSFSSPQLNGGLTYINIWGPNPRRQPINHFPSQFLRDVVTQNDEGEPEEKNNIRKSPVLKVSRRKYPKDNIHFG